MKTRIEFSVDVGPVRLERHRPGAGRRRRDPGRRRHRLLHGAHRVPARLLHVRPDAVRRRHHQSALPLYLVFFLSFFLTELSFLHLACLVLYGASSYFLLPSFT